MKIFFNLIIDLYEFVCLFYFEFFFFYIFFFQLFSLRYESFKESKLEYFFTIEDLIIMDNPSPN